MAGDYSLGTATGRIVVDGSAAERGFAVAQAAGNAFFRAVEDKVNSVQTLGKRMAAVGAGGVAGFGLAVKAASGFQAQMSAVEAVSGATEAQMEKVRAKALQLGKDTVFSASEAGLALEELIKAGVSVEDAIKGAGDATVALAAASGVSLPEAATIAANAMNQFGLSAAEVPKVADILAGAANTSAADVSGLGQSLKQVGAVANLAGLSFEDTTVALGELANAGIEGSDAGTSLKTMLSNLIPTTDKQQQVMDELGLTTYSSKKAMMILAQNGIKPVGKTFGDTRRAIEEYLIGTGKYKKDTTKLETAVQKFIKEQNLLGNEFFDSEGKVKSLREVQDLLNNSLKGYTKEQKLAKLETLFGSDAIRASAILANEGAAGYDKFSNSMKKVTAADTAKKRLDNLKGSVEQFKGALETAQITIGSVIIPALTKVIQAATFLINVFNNLPGPVQKAIAILGAVISVGLLLTGAFLALIPVIIAFVANFIAMKIITTITSMIFNFMRALILQRSVTAACAAAQNGLTRSLGVYGATLIRTRSLSAANAAGTAAMGTNFRKTSLLVKVLSFAVKGLGAAFLFITSPIGLVIAAVVAIIAILVLLYKKNETVRNFINKAWEGIKSVVGAVASWFATVVPNLFNAALDGIKSAFKATLGFIKNNWRLLITIILGPLGLIIALVTKFWPQIKAAFTTGINAIKSVWQAFWGGPFGALIKAVFGLVKAIVALGIASLRLVIYVGLNAIKAAWTATWNAIKQVAAVVWAAIKAVILPQIRLIQAGIRNSLNAIKGAFSAVGGAIKGAAKATFSAVSGAAKTGMSAFKSAVSSGGNSAKSVFSGSMRAIGNASRAVWNALPGPVQNAIKEVIKAVQGVPGKIIGFFKDAGRWLYDAGVRIMTGLLNGITSKIKAITDKLNDLTNKIKNAKGPEKVDKVLLFPVGRLIMQSLVDGFDKEEKRVLGQLAGLTATIPTVLEPAMGSVAALRGAVDMSRSGVPITTPSGAAAAMGSGSGSGNTINKKTEISITSVNPKKERTSRAVEKSLSKVNALGILDMDDED